MAFTVDRGAKVAYHKLKLVAIFGKINFSLVFYNTMIFFIYLATSGENWIEIG